MMLFSFEQSSDRKAILRNLLKKHYPFPAWRPADAKEGQSCGIYSKSIIPSRHGVLRTLRKIYTSERAIHLLPRTDRAMKQVNGS